VSEPQSGRPATGLGPGLFIARAFTQAHGGTISVESDETSGKTFSVRLPSHLGQQLQPDIAAHHCLDFRTRSTPTNSRRSWIAYATVPTDAVLRRERIDVANCGADCTSAENFLAANGDRGEDGAILPASQRCLPCAKIQYAHAPLTVPLLRSESLT
jgi:hypothetical protein